MTAQPPTDSLGWLDAMFTFEELAGQQWPVVELTEVLAVRGDRLAAVRWTIVLGKMGEMDWIKVTRVDEATDRMEATYYEATYYFDGEQVDEAIAELDRLHAELCGT